MADSPLGVHKAGRSLRYPDGVDPECTGRCAWFIEQLEDNYASFPGVHIAVRSLRYLGEVDPECTARCAWFIKQLEDNYAASFDETCDSGPETCDSGPELAALFIKSYGSIMCFGGPELAALFIKSEEAYEKSPNPKKILFMSDLAIVAWIAHHYLQFKPAYDASQSLIAMRRFRPSCFSYMPKEIVQIIARHVWASRYDSRWSGPQCSCVDCKAHR